MGRKTIWLNPPLEILLRELKQKNQEGNFSRSIGNIVERYSLLLKAANSSIPELNANEQIILNALLSTNRAITIEFLNDMPKMIELAANGSAEDRTTLKDKFEPLCTLERIAVIEKYENY